MLNSMPMPRVILSTTDVKDAAVGDFVNPDLLTGYDKRDDNRYISPVLRKTYVLNPDSTDGNGSLEIIEII